MTQTSNLETEPPDNLESALFIAYVALVKVLHKNGSIDVQELTVEIGRHIDADRADGERPHQHGHLKAMYDILLGMEPGLTVLRKRRKNQQS